jgi:hypothetical protein
VCVVLIAVLVVHVVEVGCPVEAETKRRPETSGPHTSFSSSGVAIRAARNFVMEIGLRHRFRENTVRNYE